MKIGCPYRWKNLLSLAGVLAWQMIGAQSAEPVVGEAKQPGAPEVAVEGTPPPAPQEDQGAGKAERRDRAAMGGLGPGPMVGPPGEWKPGDRERRGPGGSKGMGGPPPMWGAGFERLSEDQKRRVREALGKAWGRPEVAEARDRLMQANETMRKVIHDALMEIDPEIAGVLASMKGPEGRGHGEPPPRLPPVESPEFPGAALKRLEMELMVFSPPERREETRQLLDRVMQTPAVKEMVNQFRQAPVEERMQVMENLRRLYRETVGEQLRAYRNRNREPGSKRAPDGKSTPGAESENPASPPAAPAAPSGN